MTERELLVDCLQRLNRTGMAYMLTGSMGSNYWGIPRTTYDLDFVVQLTSESISRLLQEFRGDFHVDEEGIRAAFKPPYQFNAIDTRSALKVDFWLLQQTPFETTMFARRTQARIFDVPAWICTPEDVVLHKLYWNTISPSDRQVGDAAGVVAVQGGNLDTAYLRHWAGILSVSDILNDLLGGRIRPKQT